MGETTSFGVCLLGLIVAMVAEHFVRHTDTFKGATAEKFLLFAARVAVAVFALGALLSMPSCGRQPYFENEPDYSDLR